MKLARIAAILLLLGAGCARSTPLSTPTMSYAQKVTFQTADGVMITGIYVDAGPGSPQVLLLHMMPATKESYAGFAEKLHAAGISSLAIDFRGHGESVRRCRMKNTECRRNDFETIDYQKFSDAQQQAKILDVRAAVEWLIQNHGVQKTRLALVGASIGANLALEYLAENPEVPAAVLLSAGLDYRGVLTVPLAQRVQPRQALYFAASADDEYSLATNRTLYGLTAAQKSIKEFKTAGHGTAMFEKEPGFMDALVAWLQLYLRE